jgi:hypothetical protein
MHRPLILKGASTSRQSGEWNDDVFDVLADGVVGRSHLPRRCRARGKPWMWTLIFGHHEDRTPTHGYEPTREAGMSLISLNVCFQGVISTDRRNTF